MNLSRREAGSCGQGRGFAVHSRTAMLCANPAKAGYEPVQNRCMWRAKAVNAASSHLLRTPMSSLTPSTHRAHFAIGDEATARRVVDVLNECFFEGQAA